MSFHYWYWLIRYTCFTSVRNRSVWKQKMKDKQRCVFASVHLYPLYVRSQHCNGLGIPEQITFWKMSPLSRSYDRLTLGCDCTSCIKNSAWPNKPAPAVSGSSWGQGPVCVGERFRTDGVMDGMEPEQTQIIYRLHITDLVWGGREPYNRVYKEIHADRTSTATRCQHLHIQYCMHEGMNR